MDKNNNSGQIRRVLVVGGCTAGWLAAAHLASKLASGSPDGVKVTLVESENIPTIGIGEGTVPAIRQTLHYLGIGETKFVRECDATFNQGIKFLDCTGFSSLFIKLHYCLSRRMDNPFWQENRKDVVSVNV